MSEHRMREMARRAARATLTPDQLALLRRFRSRLARTVDGDGSRAALDRSRELLVAARQQRDTAREQLREARHQRNEGDARARSAHEALDDTREQLRQALQQRDEALGRLDEARQQRDEALRQWNEGRGRLEAGVADSEAARRGREEMEGQIAALQAQRDKVGEWFRAAQKQRDDSRALLRMVQQQRDELREQLVETREQRDRLAGERYELREQRSELRTQLDGLVNSDFFLLPQLDRLQTHRPWSRSPRRPAPLRKVAYGPVGAQNPALALLYGRCPEHGLLPFPLRRVERLDRLEPGSIFHLHWTRFVQVACDSADEARARSESLLLMLRQAKASGVELAWTIHEPLPHDCPFPEVEIELRRQLADIVSLVHVLHRCTLDEVGPYYTVPEEKIQVVEHPLYTGVYPAYTTKDAARRLLQLDDGELVVLVFGTIRPYKGIDRLLSCVSEMNRRAPERRLRVIVAGPSFESVENSQLILRAKSTPGVSIDPNMIHPSHVQVLFRAADLVVLPYHEFLNSGVLMLALTFERPTLAPDNPVTRDAVSSGLVRVFSPPSDTALAEELERVIAQPELLPPRPLDEDFARRHDPSYVADRLARALLGMAANSS